MEIKFGPALLADATRATTSNSSKRELVLEVVHDKVTNTDDEASNLDCDDESLRISGHLPSFRTCVRGGKTEHAWPYCSAYKADLPHSAKRCIVRPSQEITIQLSSLDSQKEAERNSVRLELFSAQKRILPHVIMTRQWSRPLTRGASRA